MDVPDGEITTNPAGLVDTIRRAQALADQCVEESLARTRDEQHQVDPRGPRPVIEPDRDRQPSQARPPSTPQVDRQAPAGQYNPTHGPDGAARFKTDGFPRCGRELVPWSRKREESGDCPGMFKRLVAYGKAVGYPEMMNSWDGQQVKEAVYAVTGGPDQYDDEEPAAPVGRNGYHRNGSY